MRYGQLPRTLGHVDVDCPEMLFYQYLPYKLAGQASVVKGNLEPRLQFLYTLLGQINCDFIANNGLTKWHDCYAYLTIKKMYQMPGCSFNREGWHSDGFMTDDVNYIWSDKFATIFNDGEFNLTQNDKLSLGEMEAQAKEENNIVFPNCALLCLDQYNIHKVAEIPFPAMRTFIKVSFSRDKYDLLGNSHNYELDYNWEMKTRKAERNIPQTTIDKPM